MMKNLFKCFVIFAVTALCSTGAVADRNMNQKPPVSGSSPSPYVTSEKTLQTDIIVVGGGLSGMSAGLTAVQGGAKVIIFEKLPSLGGAGVYPEGSLGIGTKMQKEEGKGNRTEIDAFGKIMDFAHWRVNAAAIRALLAHSGSTIDWVQSEGVEFKGLRTAFPPEKTLWTWHIYKKNGASVTKNFYKKILAGGGTILLETPVKKIIRNGKGEVIGVEAQNTVTGEKITAYGKGVIIATGGFANNKDMIEKYITDVNQPNMVPVKLRGPLIDGREGDGLKMAMDIGAMTAGMQTIAGNSPYVDQDPPIRQFNGADYQKQARTALSQPFLWVNKHGERFYNESAGSSFTDVYNAMTMNGGMMYSIFDDKMRQKMIAEGPVTPFNAIVVPGMPMKALDQAIEIGMKEGWCYKANTLAELARQLDIPPKTLQATIDRVNYFVKTGFDDDFGRKKEHLFAFASKGPYYALKGIRAYFLTLGGLKMNADLQVYDAKENIIPGLYVAGQDMGGLYDSSYDLLLEGSASGFALTSGRMAAQHIIKTRLKYAGDNR
jgi:fumarate reductase flavoprotein subunit